MHYEAKLTLMFSRSTSTQDRYLNKHDRPYIPNATYQIFLVLSKISQWFFYYI